MSVNFGNIPPKVAAITDFRALARKQLPQKFFDYLDGGAYDEITINDNHEAYQKIKLHKHIFRDVVSSNTATQVLGQDLTQPVILAPIGFAGLYARRGEVQAARAAKKSGVPFCLSTLSICSIEEVAERSAQPFWFQLYMLEDKTYCQELIKRAQAVGCPVLVFTVDVPVFGIRYRDIRNGLFKQTVTPTGLSVKLSNWWEYLSHLNWFYNIYMRGKPLALGNIAHFQKPAKSMNNYRITMSWEDLEWVREQWPGKLVLKGVLDPADARKAAEMGVDGIVISNHAGRHLDSTPATISILPRITDAVADKLDIIVDGGIFSGLDVLKALALGADACMIGRAWGYALAAQGERGVMDVLTMLRKELEVAMSQLGVANVGKIDKSLIEWR